MQRRTACAFAWPPQHQPSVLADPFRYRQFENKVLSPLHKAIFIADPDAVRDAIQLEGDVPSLTEYGETPLGNAISRMASHREHDVKIIRLLLDAGSDPNDGGANQPTPLVHAIEATRSQSGIILQVLGMLVTAGADIHGESLNRYLDVELSPIESAILVPNRRIVDWLLSHGATRPTACKMKSKIALRLEFAASSFDDPETLELEFNTIIESLNS